MVSPGEMQRCEYPKVYKALYVPEEERVRCFECVKPVWNISVVSAECRWQALVVLLLMQEELYADAQASASAAAD